MPLPPNDYTVLDEGLRCLREKPILDSDERQIRVAMVSLSTDVLTRIFDSAGVRLRLAIPFEVQWTRPDRCLTGFPFDAIPIG